MLLGDRLGRVAHVMLLERAPEAVVDDGIVKLARAEPQALARALEQVRRAAHALHAAGDDQVGVAAESRARRS